MDTRLPSEPRRRARTSLLLLVCALALATAACGDDGSERATDESASSHSSATGSPSSSLTPTRKTPDTSTWPTCAQTWVARKRLPSGYRGCVDGGQPVRAKKEWCSSGQVLVTYADRFYAVLGGPVNETTGLSKSTAYRRAVNACLA